MCLNASFFLQARQSFFTFTGIIKISRIGSVSKVVGGVVCGCSLYIILYTVIPKGCKVCMGIPYTVTGTGNSDLNRNTHGKALGLRRRTHHHP